MHNQIFRIKYPASHLFRFLEQFCLKTEKYYLFDINSYKKMIFHKLHENFLETLIYYYRLSKHYFITRNITYSSFITILKHICKNDDIVFTSNITYDKSKSYSNYQIYYT
jgi:hypothetical protein